MLATVLAEALILLAIPVRLQVSWDDHARFDLRAGRVHRVYEGVDATIGPPKGSPGSKSPRGVRHDFDVYARALQVLEGRSAFGMQGVSLAGGIGDPALGALAFGAAAAALEGFLARHGLRSPVVLRPRLTASTLSFHAEGHVAFKVGSALRAAAAGLRALSRG